MISLDRFNGTRSTDEDLIAEICVLNKTKAVNGEVFIIATRINESKALLKHISCASVEKSLDQMFDLCFLHLLIEVSLTILPHV